MPKIPDDMEALARRTAKDRKNLKARMKLAPPVPATMDEIRDAVADQLGVDGDGIQVFMCRRGR